MINIGIVLAWLMLALAFVGLMLVCVLAGFWRYRRMLVEAVYALLVVSVLLAVGSGAAFFAYPLSAIFGLAVIAGLFLAARVQLDRLPEPFLRRNTLTTTLAVVIFLLLSLVAEPYGHIIMLQQVLAGVVFVALLIALGLSAQTVWALTHYVFDVTAEAGSQHRLPTVTLAIPARNETLALAGCLDAALQSDYQKLEIVVLDDCSQDNTSALIKSYAHLGVRFIKGNTPSSGWLGKSNAYAELAREASGEIIFFLGVDTRLEPSSISRLMTYMETHKLDMVSVLPRHTGPFGAAVLLQELRYVWQIILPLTRRRVPVSSEAWAIRRSVLSALGGFSGVKHKIIPEGSFARRLMSANRYHFVIANSMLPMSFAKSWRSQLRSAVRLLYPTFKRRPAFATSLAFVLLVCGLGPFAGLLAAPFSIVWWLALATCSLYLLLYGTVLMRMQPAVWWLGMWLLPVVLLQQILLTLVSMARYEFSTVEWKGRNVCYPVLLHKRRRLR